MNSISIKPECQETSGFGIVNNEAVRPHCLCYQIIDFMLSFARMLTKWINDNIINTVIPENHSSNLTGFADFPYTR